MSIAHDTGTDFSFPSRLQALPKNLLLPGARFTLFALTAIIAGAALAFVT